MDPLRRRLLAAAAAGPILRLPAALASPPVPTTPVPLVIAHRGASGCRPEHTLAAYALAIEQGADFIEPDLVSTRDGVLVARHENALALLHPDGTLREATTDVADHPAFAARRRTKVIDGRHLTGWFSEDFTLAELRTLRARERLPALRGTAHDGLHDIPTLDEILALQAAENERRAAAAGGGVWRPLGVYPETKHPSYFRGLGLPLEEPLLAALHRHGLRGPGAPVFIQSFEVGNLRRLRERTELPLVQLMDLGGGPWDGAGRWDELATPAGLAGISRYAQAVGVPLRRVRSWRLDGCLGAATPLVAQAHDAGLQVHAWTLRIENAFLPRGLRRGRNPAAHGDFAALVQAQVQAGVDGFFTDHPGPARAALAMAT